MSIIRGPRPTEKYYVLDKRISEDWRLSWAARGLLVYLLGKPDSWEVSVAALVKETEGSGKPTKRDGMYSLLRELEAAGYLSRRQERSDAGTFEAADYLVHELPCRDEPLTANPFTANPTQTSTDPNQVLKEQQEDISPSVISRLAAPSRPAIPMQEIVDLYHAILPMGISCRKLTAKRRAAITARWKSGDLPDLDTWRQYFERAAKSKFIRGEVAPSNGFKQFQVSLDYLIREDSYAKALENAGAFKW